MPEHQMPKQHYHQATYRTQYAIGYLVKRAHSMMLDIMEPVFEARGFTFIQYVIMSWLRDGIAVNPKDICALYRHDSGALTRVIDQLAERGLVERVRRDRDRRKVELQLTPAGRETIESLVPLVVEKLNAALAEFSSEEVTELQRLLIKLNTKLQSAVGPEAARVSETPRVEA
jgi:DNA-binding MarR family transcriptional regulator